MVHKQQVPLVTIITPTYNRATMVSEVIESVLNQKYPNLEYLVLDDGSQDNTKTVLRKYGKLIKYLFHKNMGETRTVIKGMKLAKGEIVAIVNSDDPLLPHAIKTVVNFMQTHPEVLAVYPDWQLIGPDSEVISTITVPEYNYIYMFSRHHCLPGPGAFIRSKALKLIGYRDPDFKYVGDFAYWLRLGMYGPLARIPRVLATFRTHAGSQSLYAKNDNMAEEHLQLVDKIIADPHLPAAAKKYTYQAYSSAYFHAANTYKTFSKRVVAYVKSFYFSPMIFGEKLKYELVKLRQRIF